MKKEYCKPKAFVQNLTVNCFTAGGCSNAGALVVNFTEDKCYYTGDDGITYFSRQCESGDGWGVDIVNPNPYSDYAQLCYHRPLDADIMFFNS